MMELYPGTILEVRMGERILFGQMREPQERGLPLELHLLAEYPDPTALFVSNLEPIHQLTIVDHTREES